MARPLAALLCISSVLCFQAGCVEASSVRLLTPEQLEKPAQVSAWLKQNAAAADKRRAAAAFAEGANEARRNNWGPAIKAYGLSALLLPTPQALNAYADARLRSAGAQREHKGNRSAHQDRDLHSFEALSRSALASDAVAPSLSSDERRQTAANADCVAAFRRDKIAAPTCAPLRMYGLIGG